MDTKTNRENQKRFTEAQKAKGLKRVVLWARPEDVDDLKLAARQPHSLSKLKKRVEKDLLPKVEASVKAALRRRTQRAMLVQARSEARRQPAGANRPPSTVRFQVKPSEAVRAALRASGWRWDPVAAVWHLPDDPALYEASTALLRDLEQWQPIPLTHAAD